MSISSGWPSDAQFQSALDQSAIVGVTDRRGTIVYCNRKFCEVSGYTEEELVGKNHRVVNSGYHDREFFRQMYTRIAAGQTWRGTIRNRRKDGSIYWVDTTIIPFKDEGQVAGGGYISIRFDVTAHVEALEALAEANRRAQAAAEAKDEFLANMSHEVRTPLNGIMGLTEALSTTSLDPVQNEMVQLVLKSGESLGRILDDILDLSRAEAGGVRLEARTFDLQAELAPAAELMRARAMEKGLDYQVVFSDAARGPLVGDSHRIRQIISNLTSNAVKFTRSGRVSVQLDLARPAPDVTGPARLLIEVEDTGVGFGRDQADRLFRPFTQANGEIARTYGGSGLGLAICQRLAELMGGSIEAVSQPGRGSRFSVSLPVELAATPVLVAEGQEPLRGQETQREPAAAGAPFQDLEVLLVEDHPVNQMVVRHMLEPLGARITIADDGVSGVDRFCEADFDVVFMDMRMPQMDGLEATRRIRAIEASLGRGRTPLVMMTANAWERDRAAAAECGADAFIAKPVSLQALVELTWKLVLDEAQETAAAETEAGGDMLRAAGAA